MLFRKCFTSTDKMTEPSILTQYFQECFTTAYLNPSHSFELKATLKHHITTESVPASPLRQNLSAGSKTKLTMWCQTLGQVDSVAFRRRSAEDRHTFSCTLAASCHQFSTHKNKSDLNYLSIMKQKRTIKGVSRVCKPRYVCPKPGFRFSGS